MNKGTSGTGTRAQVVNMTVEGVREITTRSGSENAPGTEAATTTTGFQRTTSYAKDVEVQKKEVEKSVRFQLRTCWQFFAAAWMQHSQQVNNCFSQLVDRSNAYTSSTPQNALMPSDPAHIQQTPLHLLPPPQTPAPSVRPSLAPIPAFPTPRPLVEGISHHPTPHYAIDAPPQEVTAYDAEFADDL